jgi:signal transduction histidine kinase
MEKPHGAAAQSFKITLIDGSQQVLQPFYEALTAQGYHARLFNDPNEALLHLSKTDVLLIDSNVASQPKSSKLIKVPTILVLTENGNDKLPPWLEARHVHLLPYFKHPDELIERLPDYMIPTAPDFGIDSTNTEHLALLFGITQSLSGQLDIYELIERILALTANLKAEFAAILIQEGDETIYYRSTQPGREELTGPAGRRFAKRLINDGLEGWVLRHNQAVILPNTLNDSRWLRASYLPEHEHCVAALPITLERVDARGVYLIGHTRPGHFSKSDFPLLEAIVTQIGLAIENAMLFKNQSERSIQLSLINEVSQAATSILNLDAMLRTVVEAVRRSFTFFSVSIHLYNADTRLIELRAKAPSEHLEPTPPKPVIHRLRQGLIGWSLAINKTILANDVTRDPRYIFNSNNKEVRAELCAPITLGVKTIGVLNLQSTQLEAFDRYHVAAMETLADQLAIAVENARLYDEINQHLKELKSLNEIGQAITSTLELRKTLTLITDHITRLIEVAAASVALRDNEAGEIWFAAASGEGSQAVIGLRIQLGQGVAGWVAEQGEAVMVGDAYTDSRFYAEVDQHSGFTTQSILCVPLQTKGQTIGAIEVMNKKNGPFNKEDLSLLQALAVSAATAIENAQLYEEKIRTIERLAETQSQLIQSAKLAAVGELAAGVAHEINNPLTTIIGFTSLLLDDSKSLSKEELREDLYMIYEEARRARDIVRSLLDFARADRPKRQPIDLNQLIEEAIVLVYTKAISQKIELEKSLAPLPEMLLDVNQIKQVIVNLLNNAVQAMWDNGSKPARLSISTSLVLQPMAGPVDRAAGEGFNSQRAGTTNTKEHAASMIKREASGEAVIICRVSDTGQGIKPEHLDKIFDPFFTTKEVGQGTGLGLSISYGIIEQHGGHINVDSSSTEGTAFTLTLPVTVPGNL